MGTNVAQTAAVKITLVAAFASILVGCASPNTPQPAITSSTHATNESGTTITAEMIGRGRGEMVLTSAASDPAYGFSEKSPVLIGGGFGEGSARTYQYLNALRGSGGEKISYDRVGTCCPFKSPNALFGGQALLEVFEIVIPGSAAPKRIYFNWYDAGETLIPVGLSAAR